MANNPTGWIGLVLAGGASSRMGTDKALLELRGRTLLDRAIAVLEAAGEDLLDATASLTGAGLYELVVINHSDTTHVLSAAATLGPGGTYGPP